MTRTDVCYTDLNTDTCIGAVIDDVVAINNEKVNLLDLQKKRPSFKESLISTAVIEAAHISLENDSKWQIIEMDD